MEALARARPLVVICTRDRAVSTPFYRDVLGLPLMADDMFAAVFSVGGEQLRLSTVPDWKAHGHAVFGFSVQGISALVRGLADKGVVFNRYDGFSQDEDGVWTTPDKSARVAWFCDPDGNVLSLTEFTS